MSYIKEKVLEDIYTNSAVGEEESIEYLLKDFPYIPKNLHLIDEILYDIDCSKLNGQMLYQLVFVMSPYFNHLKNYSYFYNNIVTEAKSRGYSDTRIHRLFSKYEKGSDALWDPEYKRPKTYQEIDAEKLEQKIAWAKEIKDKDLENILTSYKEEKDRDSYDRAQSHAEEVLYGDVEYIKKIAMTLREMAAKLESSGPHHLIYAKLPKLPLFGPDYEFFESADLYISIGSGHFMGG